MRSIFEYKYKSNLIDIMEFLKNKKIEYIEIPPIIPKHAEMYLPLQKEFSNKGIYTIASFNINFNIINKVLIERKVKNCYTAVKGVYKNKESTYIYIQCTDIEKNVKPSVIFVDPPRRGLDETTIQNILNVSPAKLVYISCNPATMVRDFKLWEEKYKIKVIQPVDMFPFTSHVECVAVLEVKETVR